MPPPPQTNSRCSTRQTLSSFPLVKSVFSLHSVKQQKDEKLALRFEKKVFHPVLLFMEPAGSRNRSELSFASHSVKQLRWAKHGVGNKKMANG